MEMVAASAAKAALITTVTIIVFSSIWSILEVELIQLNGAA